MARGYANVKFNWNGSRSAVIQNLGFGDGLQRDAAEILLRESEPYTPYLSGRLDNSAYVRVQYGKGYIIYPVPYSNKQYQGIDINEGNRAREVHPNATSRWIDVAWQHNKREITKQIDLARLKYRSFNYGKK